MPSVRELFENGDSFQLSGKDNLKSTMWDRIRSGRQGTKDFIDVISYIKGFKKEWII